jgi:hypothetical protein
MIENSNVCCGTRQWALGNGQWAKGKGQRAMGNGHLQYKDARFGDARFQTLVVGCEELKGLSPAPRLRREKKVAIKKKKISPRNHSHQCQKRSRSRQGEKIKREWAFAI